MPVLAPEQFAAEWGVSREALDRLSAYVALLEKWNKAYNLVGKETLRDLWRRHILDSAQLLPHIPEGSDPLLDVGSGAGLPGLVLAILGVSDIHLVEASQKKAAFLNEARRQLSLSVTVHDQRLESTSAFACRAIIARAFAPLPKLLDMVADFSTAETCHVYLKGRGYRQELEEAQKYWVFGQNHVRSASVDSGSGNGSDAGGGVILMLNGVQKRVE